VQLKTLPARTALEATSEGDYFKGDNDLFMTLFRYIDKNSLAMTVPVESDISEVKMRFFVGQKVDTAALEKTDKVAVRSIPESLVISAGLRGGYNAKTYQRGEQRLDDWLKANPEYQAVGEPFGVFWNGPFVPGFLKRSEVNWQVVKKASAEKK